jgi:intracellular multiplication protein IcmT
MRHPETAHWRDSARTPRFFFIDGFSAIPLLLFLLHIRLWTFVLACSICAFFMALNRFGFTLPVFIRWLRAFTAGSERRSRPFIKRKE